MISIPYTHSTHFTSHTYIAACTRKRKGKGGKKLYIKFHNLYAIVCCLDKEMKSAKSKVFDAITRSWSVSIRERKGKKRELRIQRH